MTRPPRRRQRRALAGWLGVAVLVACSGARDPADVAPEVELPLTPDGALDLSGGAWRMIDVPTASNGPTLVQTPEGWLALSSRSFGGKLVTGAESILYRSADGVHWRAIRLPSEDLLTLTGLAYGNGRYVMVGRHGALGGVIWTSRDGVDWDEEPQGLTYTDVWRSVTFVGGHFFAHGFAVLGVSDDGEAWDKVGIDIVQVIGLAHGDGRFVMTGSGPVMTSEDGRHWQSHEVDCSLPGSCLTDPGGVTHPLLLSAPLFAESRFFVGRLVSDDGVAWSVASDLPADAYYAGHFFNAYNYTLSAWRAGGASEAVPSVRPSRAAVTADGRAITSVGVLHDDELPDEVDVGFEDGLTCLDATCVLIGGRLFLVPPPGTPPLPDRVPRTASDEPLLSDECPVSSTIFCDDYEARTGCRCDPSAPRDPSFCDDVSQYACEGVFSHREGEWDVDDVAEGGCSCDGVDPNQPATFGLPCGVGDTTCEAPLACLPVQPPPSPEPEPRPTVCTSACVGDADCPSWEATGFCAGHVELRCVDGACQPRSCE